MMETFPETGIDALPGLGAFFGFSILFCLIVYVYFCAFLMKIANRTGTPNAWMAWVPILNFILMCRIARRPTWWVAVMLIPLVNVIAFIVIWMAIAEACGKPGWIGLVIVVPLVGLLVPAYLAFAGGAEATVAPQLSHRAATAPSPPPAVAACSGCGVAAAPGDAFCGSCGQAIPSAPAPAPAPATQASVGTSSSPIMLYVLLAVVAVVVMAAVGFFGLRLLTQSADDGASGFTVEDPVALSPSDASGSEYPSEDPVHAPTPQYQSSTSEERQPADLPARVNRRNEPSLEETYAANQGYEEGKADPPGGVQNATVDIASGAETGPTYQGPSGPVDLPDGGTNTADDDFIAAAFEGPVERVLDLIGRGANRNGRDEAGRTPLMMAVLGGDPDIVGILAATGADLNATDTDGRTALHYAIDPFVVDILLGEGANPNARDRSGVTPLMEAADAGEPDTVMMLLDYGADPNIRDAAGRTAMSIARQNGFDDISQVLAEGRGGG